MSFSRNGARRPAVYLPPIDQLELFDPLARLRVPQADIELPASAQALVEVIGVDATMALVRELGGATLDIPEVVAGTSQVWAQLEELIGHDAAASMVTVFKHTKIYVPKCEQALKRIRDQEIIRRADAGATIAELRRDYKVSDRHIYRILKRPL